MDEARPCVYRFGGFVLDVGDRSLKRDGIPIGLTPRLFDLLVALVARAGRLAEKDTLLRSVWAGVLVEENNLTKGVLGLRRLLGQNERTVYIQTVPKRGYRFVAAVTVHDAPLSTDSMGDGPPLYGSGAGSDSMPVARVSPALRHSIAVLPFSDVSENHDQEYFCDG